MNVRRITTIFLSVFIIASFVWLGYDSLNGKTPAAPVKSEKTVMNSSQLVVYYFHGKYRCYSCKMIESLTEKSLKHNFNEELASRRIVLKAVDVSESLNKHYIRDYGLYTKSVVLSLVKDNRETKWKILKKTWEYLNNEAAFEKYIITEITGFQEGK